MKKAHLFGLFLGFIAGLLLSPSGAEAGRPPSPLVMSYQLNGEFTRPAGEDGGGGLLLQGTTNIASVPVTLGGVYYVECGLDGGAAWVCASSTDGGCSTTFTDINAGVYVPPGQVGKYFVTRDSTQHTGPARIYATGTATTFTCPVFLMQ